VTTLHHSARAMRKTMHMCRVSDLPPARAVAGVMR
jgi:hypothetical protein